MPSSYNPLHPHPTSEWSSLQQVFYRKSTIYQLSWSIDSDSLSNSDLKAAENGGLLAILRNRSNLQKVALNTRLSTKRERDRDSLAIYTQPGRLVESIPLDSSNKVISFGFTSSEKLVVILEEGIVRTYTLLTPCPTTIDANSTSTSDPNSTSNPPSTSTSDLNNPPIPIEATPNSYYISYSLGSEANEIGLKEARIWKDGLVALTNNNRFIQWKFPLDDLESNGINRNHDDDYGNNVSSPELLPSFELEIDSNSEIVWNFLNPKVSNSGLVEILISPSTIPSTVSISNPIANGNPSSSSVSTSSSTQNEEEGQGTLYSLDILSGIKNNHLKKGPFSSIKPSPNGKLLSLLTFNRKLWVVSSDFQRSLSEFDIEDCSSFQEAEVVTTTINGAASTSRNDNGSQKWNKGGIGGTGIKQIEWCGDFTVALAWEKEVVMVGPFGDSIRYQHPSSIHLISESDGLRIISSTTSDFITKVPSSSTSIFLPGSTHPGSILLESYENFLLKNPKADDGIRTLRSSSGNGNGGSGSKDGDLIQAVETLTMASAFEFDIHWQKKLLKAANFGKGFLENFHPKDFVEMSRKLRVINQLRSAEIGIPISYEQYISVPVTSIISRLTQRNHHLLSIKLSEFLNLKPDSILKHWAKSKISRMKSMTPNSVVIGSSESNEIEDQVSESIIKKFAQQPSANYSSVAKVAFKAGRIRLATKLLDHEPRAVDQVPLLLNMHEDKLALIKALESGDTDLIYHVILRLKSQLSRGDFFRIIQSPQLDQSLTSTTPSISSTSNNINSTTSYLSLASNLLQVYALEQDRELLKDFYYQDDRRTENALLVLEDARNEEDVMEKTFLLKEAMKLFSEDRERGLEAKLTDEQIRLIGFQTALDKEENTASLTKSSFLGLSLNETLKALLAQPHLSSKVEKLRSDFKVPEKRFWNLKLKVLIESKDFDGLWTWASGKKSPIGYEPFVSKLIREGYGKEALRYVSLAAKDKNDRAKLSALCQRIPQQQIANEIVQILEDL